MNRDDSIVSDLSCWITAAIFALGLVVLAVRLRDVQVVESADYSYASSRQSVRRLQTTGPRGRILGRRGEVLAGNRKSFSIVCDAVKCQKKTWRETEEEIKRRIDAVAVAIGRKSAIDEKAISRHVRQSLAIPLTVWRDIDYPTLAKFVEHEGEFEGFSCQESEERVYPQGRFAAHLLGYVGRDAVGAVAGDEKINFVSPEMRGRAGIEMYYDGFLRGVPGERKLLVDARGFAIRSWTVAEAKRGPDLRLALDLNVQRAAERALSGQKGACVVLDPRTGDVLAFASAPTYNPNDFVPFLGSDLYDRLSSDPAKPLLNRASGGSYAPGSTFKPVIALAALAAGIPADGLYDCVGEFTLGEMRLRCVSVWGHGSIDMRRALMKSCNPYFCNLGMDIGTNAIFRAADAFGLGSRTGIDFSVDAAGAVPDAEWKMRRYSERWYPGDLAQMSIGQGMLLVTPLQMAMVAGAIGTGRIVTPHIKADLPIRTRPLPFSKEHLAVVREGMYFVVNGNGSERGTGMRAAEGVPVEVCGKTGTAEIGRGASRRKNAWFIAYAPARAPSVALAIVVENGEGGGTTAAPLAASILRAAFGGERSANSSGGL